jgi:stearoyl-CoA desaturase (delta-9 desaturase)
MRGAFYAHMGWIYFKAPVDRDFKCVPDLIRNRLVLWQDRFYLPIAITVGFLLPGALASVFGRPFLGGLLWGGLIRVVIVHHMTFCINSLAHMVGNRPYSLDNTARDSWWLALITYGEGYHNFHHRFAADYRNGYRWYQWDPTKWWIHAMVALGQAGRLVRYRDELVLRARIETDLRNVLERVSQAPDGLALRVQRRLEDARLQLETAASQWEEARVRCRIEGRRALREYRIALQEAKARWNLLIDSLERLPDPVA